MNAIFSEYLEYLRGIKHFSLNTIDAYKKDLSIFEDWIQEVELEFQCITKSNIMTFVAEMSDRHFSTSYINRMLSTIRGFYKYAIRKKLIDINPTIGIKNFRMQHKIRSFLFPSEMKSLCQLPGEIEILWMARDIALFSSLYSTGARASELLSLDVEDINFNLSSAIVMGKGKKEREVFFTSFVKQALKNYFVEREVLLKERHKVVEKGSNPLFLNMRGSRLSIWGVNYIIKRYIRFCPNIKSLSAHSFRHSFATALISRGADIRIVQELLGHENISTTQNYTHVTTEKLYELYKKAHPHS
ncbi:MAG: tyrosine-type recombinase/integrase [Treponema sp.]